MADQPRSEAQLRVVHPPQQPATAATPASNASKGKPRPKMFRALGRAEPPPSLEAGGESYSLLEVLKHDSWAATAIYHNEHEKIVCKFNRQQAIGLLPMRWLGRKLAARENYLLRRLGDLPGVPDYRGPIVVDGQLLDNAASHVFVEGHPLQAGDDLPDSFFDQLRDSLGTMHARGIAYVDLHKGENILVGDDGRSYVIDFQVCFIRPHNRWLAWLLGPIERALYDMDRYHFRKHLCVHRPDLAGCTIKEFKRSGERPWWLNIHRKVAVPLRSLRRWFLVKLGIRKGEGHATSEHFAEAAVRRQIETESMRKAA